MSRRFAVNSAGESAPLNPVNTSRELDPDGFTDDQLMDHLYRVLATNRNVLPQLLARSLNENISTDTIMQQLGFVDALSRIEQNIQRRFDQMMATVADNFRRTMELVQRSGGVSETGGAGANDDEAGGAEAGANDDEGSAPIVAYLNETEPEAVAEVEAGSDDGGAPEQVEAAVGVKSSEGSGLDKTVPASEVVAATEAVPSPESESVLGPGSVTVPTPTQATDDCSPVGESLVCNFDQTTCQAPSQPATSSPAPVVYPPTL